MSRAVKTLRTHLLRVADEGGMSDGDAVRVMSLTRQVIEGSNLQSSHGLLNFYCNWCLHTELTRSTVCWEMLDRVTDVFLSDNGTHPVDISQRVSEIFSLTRLRREALDLYTTRDLPVFLFSSMSNWRGFGSQLLKEITHKPIGFPADLSTTRLVAIFANRSETPSW